MRMQRRGKAREKRGFYTTLSAASIFINNE